MERRLQVRADGDPAGNVQPYPGGPQPYPGGPQPYPGSPQPYMGNTQPYAGSPQPYPGSTQPCAGGVGYGNVPPYPGNPQPYMGDPQPYMGSPQPYMGNPQPYMGNPQPYPGDPQPYMGNPQPYPGNPQPYMGSPQPYMGNPQPYAGGAGYGNVPPYTPVLVLECVSGELSGTKYTIEKGRTFTIGRGSRNNIQYSDQIKGISRQHCSVTFDGRTALVTDLNSSHGTFFANGVRMQPNMTNLLNNGESFCLASPKDMFRVVIR